MAVLTAYTGGFFRARLTFPSEYPLLPPKMRFETPIFHPNSELFFLYLRVMGRLLIPYSLPERRSLHLDPTSPRRRQVRLRIRRRALVPCPNTRDHSPLRYIHAVQPER